MKITLKDGVVKEFDSPVSVLDIAKSISEGLARNACCGMVNGEVEDLRTIVSEDAEVSICTVEDAEGLRTLRHTASHIMAQAIKRLFPETKLAIGPAIKDGFSKESLQALEVVINVGQSVRGSEFEDIEDALKSNNIERAVAWMFDLQIKLDRFKRTGKPY